MKIDMNRYMIITINLGLGLHFTFRLTEFNKFLTVISIKGYVAFILISFLLMRIPKLTLHITKFCFNFNCMNLNRWVYNELD